MNEISDSYLILHITGCFKTPFVKKNVDNLKKLSMFIFMSGVLKTLYNLQCIKIQIICNFKTLYVMYGCIACTKSCTMHFYVKLECEAYIA